ncbi:uncharacterized protein LOC136030867 [Artemia franciscana]|uniref:uncharacterized protein LOC136030867 n=1 Tax=Artemia franciscana TaxID=6661 RepID=UPI0032DBBFE8
MNWLHRPGRKAAKKEEERRQQEFFSKFSKNNEDTSQDKLNSSLRLLNPDVQLPPKNEGPSFLNSSMAELIYYTYGVKSSASACVQMDRNPVSTSIDSVVKLSLPDILFEQKDFAQEEDINKEENPVTCEPLLPVDQNIPRNERCNVKRVAFSDTVRFVQSPSDSSEIEATQSSRNESFDNTVPLNDISALSKAMKEAQVCSPYKLKETQDIDLRMDEDEENILRPILLNGDGGSLEEFTSPKKKFKSESNFERKLLQKRHSQQKEVDSESIIYAKPLMSFHLDSAEVSEPSERDCLLPTEGSDPKSSEDDVLSLEVTEESDNLSNLSSRTSDIVSDIVDKVTENDERPLTYQDFVMKDIFKSLFYEPVNSFSFKE